MIVHITDPKFVFIHIPKTAGSSFRTSLYENFDNENLKNFDLNQHITANELHQFFNKNSLNWDEYFKFSFVRNPWSRIVSYYEYQFKEHITFSSFCKTSKDSQLAYLTNKESDILVDFIGKFENLQEDSNTIFDKIGVPQQLPHKNKTKHKHYTEYYNEETKQNVAENYKDDILYFGYEFD